MKPVKLFSLIFLITATGCRESSLDTYGSFSNWEVSSASQTSISWAKFEWNNGTLGGKFYERIGINVPCTIDEIPNPLTFQLDLGADLTGVYEKSFSGFYPKYPGLLNKIKSGNNRYYENLTLHFGSYAATNNSGYVFKDYGSFQSTGPGDVVHLGTIGADIFKDKVLIIDYPNQRFAICDKVPSGYEENLVDISLDDYGRVILPMKLEERRFNIMFDTGSSLFPIITSVANVSLFTTSPDIDAMQISAWGQLHNVTGKMIESPVMLGGQTFSNVKVYAADFNLGINRHLDGITGNILFWERTVVIDFKNKKFGVK